LMPRWTRCIGIPAIWIRGRRGMVASWKLIQS
jgi:hypothetical protein